MPERGLNKVMIIGNLGNDPEIRYSAGGSSFVTFSVATSEYWTDKDGNDKEATEWHRCVAGGKLGDIVNNNAKKGTHVYVEGRLKTRRWQDTHGTEKFSTDIRVDKVQFLDPKPKATSNQYQSAKQGAGGGGGFYVAPSAGGQNPKTEGLAGGPGSTGIPQIDIDEKLSF